MARHGPRMKDGDFLRRPATSGSAVPALPYVRRVGPTPTQSPVHRGRTATRPIVFCSRISSVGCALPPVGNLSWFPSQARNERSAAPALDHLEVQKKKTHGWQGMAHG